MAPGTGAGVIRSQRTMNTGPYPQICRVWPCSLPNDPGRASRSRSFAGLIQNDGHGGGAAAVATDVVCAVGLICPAFVQLIEVNNLRSAVGKADVPQRSNGSAAVLRVLGHPIAQEQAEILSIVFGYRFLAVGQVEHRIGKVALPVIGEGVDVPGLLLRLHHVCGFRVIILYRPGLAGAGVGVEAAFALPENSLHIRQGDSVPGVPLGGAVLGDKGVGVAAHAGGVGVDNLVVISASGSEVLGNPGLRIGDALAQNLIDGKSDVVGVLDDGGIVIEDGLAGAAAAGQAAEDQGGQHEDEQHREHEQNSGGSEELLSMLRGIQSSPRRRAVWPAHCRALCGSGDGLASLDGPMDGLSSAGRLGQAAFFLVVQF